MNTQDIPESHKRLVEMEEGFDSIAAGNPRKLPALLARLRQQELAVAESPEAEASSKLRKAG